jgi:hypothetical protein
LVVRERYVRRIRKREKTKRIFSGLGKSPQFLGAALSQDPKITLSILQNQLCLYFFYSPREAFQELFQASVQGSYNEELRNCSRIKCDAFYSNCLRNNEITCPKGQVISEQFLKDWRGYLPMAIDGSHVALPPDAALREYYGATGHEQNAVTARASVL